MQNSQLPVDLLHWALALLPIVVLLVLLVVMRWKAPQAGPMGMFTAAAVAVLGFATPWETIAVASAKGIWGRGSRSKTCRCTSNDYDVDYSLSWIHSARLYRSSAESVIV
jgi:hypothetical protein